MKNHLQKVGQNVGQTGPFVPLFVPGTALGQRWDKIAQIYVFAIKKAGQFWDSTGTASFSLSWDNTFRVSQGKTGTVLAGTAWKREN